MIDYLILRLETYPQDAGTRPFGETYDKLPDFQAGELSAR